MLENRFTSIKWDRPKIRTWTLYFRHLIKLSVHILCCCPTNGHFWHKWDIKRGSLRLFSHVILTIKWIWCKSEQPKPFRDNKINQYHGSFIPTVCDDMFHDSHLFACKPSRRHAAHVDNSSVEVSGEDMETTLVVGKAAVDKINNTIPSANLGTLGAKPEPRGFCLRWTHNGICDPGHDPDRCL